jgi:hypothetical protein
LWGNLCLIVLVNMRRAGMEVVAIGHNGPLTRWQPYPGPIGMGIMVK